MPSHRFLNTVNNMPMKKYLIFAVSLHAALFLTSCHEEVVQPPLPELSVSGTSFEFKSGGGTEEFTVSTNRSFTVISDASWLAFDPASVEKPAGEAGEHSVTVTALPNSRYESRTGVITVKILSDYQNITVSQSGNQDATPSLIYRNDFDKGSQSGNPFVDETDIWRNETGVGTSTAVYYASGVSVRTSRTSSTDGNKYPDYTASGSNNLFFGSGSPYFVIANLALQSAHKDLALTFGVDPGMNAVFSDEDFPVMISRNGTDWVTLQGCRFSEETGAAPEGKWALASIYFSLPEPVSQLWLRFAPGVPSMYRIDDLTLRMADEDEADMLVTVDWSDSKKITVSGTPIE